MIDRIVKKSKLTLVATGLVVGLMAFAASKPASAANPFTDCTPNQVEWFPGSAGGQLLIQCNGTTNFLAQVASSCAGMSASVDTIKLFMSLAQAGVLAQKPMRIYNAPCGTANLITALDLNK